MKSEDCFKMGKVIERLSAVERNNGLMEKENADLREELKKKDVIINQLEFSLSECPVEFEPEDDD